MLLAAGFQLIKEGLVAELVVLQKGEVVLVVPLGDFVGEVEDAGKGHRVWKGSTPDVQSPMNDQIPNTQAVIAAGPDWLETPMEIGH